MYVEQSPPNSSNDACLWTFCHVDDTRVSYCPHHMTIVVPFQRIQCQIYSLKEGYLGSKKGSVPFKNSLERTLLTTWTTLKRVLLPKTGQKHVLELVATAVMIYVRTEEGVVMEVDVDRGPC